MSTKMAQLLSVRLQMGSLLGWVVRFTTKIVETARNHIYPSKQNALKNAVLNTATHRFLTRACH
jgi:hypothetical protein